jgi:hypothetical protein
MTIELQQVLTLLMVSLVAFSSLAAPASASLGTSDSGVQFQSAGEDAVNACVENVDTWGYIAPVYGAYQCIDGAFSPSDYDSSSELENEAYNNMISVQDTVETRQNGWQNWDELSQTSNRLKSLLSNLTMRGKTKELLGLMLKLNSVSTTLLS